MFFIAQIFIKSVIGASNISVHWLYIPNLMWGSRIKNIVQIYCRQDYDARLDEHLSIYGVGIDVVAGMNGRHWFCDTKAATHS